jgi:hypothetical protein
MYPLYFVALLCAQHVFSLPATHCGGKTGGPNFFYIASVYTPALSGQWVNGVNSGSDVNVPQKFIQFKTVLYTNASGMSPGLACARVCTVVSSSTASQSGAFISAVLPPTAGAFLPGPGGFGASPGYPSGFTTSYNPQVFPVLLWTSYGTPTPVCTEMAIFYIDSPVSPSQLAARFWWLSPHDMALEPSYAATITILLEVYSLS